MIGIRRGFCAQFKCEQGQTLTEFALIIVLIAVVLVTSLSLFGGKIANAFQSVSSELAIAVDADGASQTPLGSTFTEISQGFIKLMQDYYAKYGRYPGWNQRYTALGLDPDDWNKPIDHIWWGVNSGRVSISPEDGYDFCVTDLSGKTRTLTPELNWNIWYDAPTSKWYYHDVDPLNEIIISTLKVTPKPSPLPR